MKNGMIRKATKSFVGRVLRRLLGEEKGAVMMEYIVVALLIAAACVLAVAFFGQTITEMFGSLSSSVAGHPKQADTTQQTMQSNVNANTKLAQGYARGKHDGKPQGTGVGEFGAEGASK